MKSIIDTCVIIFCIITRSCLYGATGYADDLNLLCPTAYGVR